MSEPRILTKSGNTLICIDDIVLNIDSKNSGKSYFKLKSQFRDRKLYYSYVFRRVNFLKELVELNKIYQGIFYIEFTENQKRWHKLKSKKTNSLRKVEIQNQYCYPIAKSDISRIISITGRESDNVYNEGAELKKTYNKAYNFTFVWERLKDSNIQLEVKKLKQPKHKNRGERNQTYFHCVFDKDLKYCIHTDSHLFSFSKEHFSMLQSGTGNPKTKGEFSGRRPQAKYDQFAMAKGGVITSYEAITLLTKFIGDTRVDCYFKQLIDETSILRP